MASETQTWWSGHYAKYTLHNLSSMPAYASFKAQKSYQTRTDGTRTETFWTVDNCNIYEWFLHSESKGEKIGFDGWGKTWFYEMWTPEVDHHLTIKTWLKPNSSEWGLIIRRYPDKEIREKWSHVNGVKSHEIEEAEGPKVTSHKTGFVGADEWTEDRVWLSDSGRDRGTAVGVKGGQRFEHKWDNDDPNRLDQNEYWDGPRNWGNRYRARGPQWIREDWDGWKPDSGAGGSPDYSAQLFECYTDVVNALRDSEATLDLMVDEEHKAALATLKNQRGGMPKPDSTDAEGIIRAINRAHSLLQDHETLKRELLDGERKGRVNEIADYMDTLYAIMVKNDAVCDTLAAALKDAETKAKLDKFEDEFERINREFGETMNTEKLGEMLALLLRYQPINYEMAGRLHGMSSEQSAQDMSDTSKGGLKQQRAKVRSGRPAASAFDVISEKLNRDLEITAILLDQFAEDESADAKSKAAQALKGDPIETIMRKIDVLTELLSLLGDSNKLQEVQDSANAALTNLQAVFTNTVSDEDSAAKAESELNDDDDHQLAAIRRKMTTVNELLSALSVLEIQIEDSSTTTSAVTQESREETMKLLEIRDAELVRTKEDLTKAQNKIKILSSEVAELNKEHEELKDLRAEHAIVLAEKERLAKLHA